VSTLWYEGSVQVRQVLTVLFAKERIQLSSLRTYSQDEKLKVIEKVFKNNTCSNGRFSFSLPPTRASLAVIS